MVGLEGRAYELLEDYCKPKTYFLQNAAQNHSIMMINRMPYIYLQMMNIFHLEEAGALGVAIRPYA